MRNDFMLDMQKGPAEGAMVQIELILVFDQSPASWPHRPASQSNLNEFDPTDGDFCLGTSWVW